MFKPRNLVGHPVEKPLSFVEDFFFLFKGNNNIHQKSKKQEITTATKNRVKEKYTHNTQEHYKHTSHGLILALVEDVVAYKTEI